MQTAYNNYTSFVNEKKTYELRKKLNKENFSKINAITSEHRILVEQYQKNTEKLQTLEKETSKFMEEIELLIKIQWSETNIEIWPFIKYLNDKHKEDLQNIKLLQEQQSNILNSFSCDKNNAHEQIKQIISHLNCLQLYIEIYQKNQTFNNTENEKNISNRQQLHKQRQKAFMDTLDWYTKTKIGIRELCITLKNYISDLDAVQHLVETNNSPKTKHYKDLIKTYKELIYDILWNIIELYRFLDKNMTKDPLDLKGYFPILFKNDKNLYKKTCMKTSCNDSTDIAKQIFSKISEPL